MGTKEYQRKYCENNKEKIREAQRKYRENNKEKIREAQRKYRENNKEKILEQKKKYRVKKDALKKLAKGDLLPHEEDKYKMLS